MKFISLLLFMLAMTGGVRAQRNYVSSADIRDITVNRIGERIVVSFRVDASDLQLKSRCAVQLTPRLQGAQQSCVFSPMQICGRRAWYYRQRNPSDTVNMLRADRGLYEYAASAPFESWMNRSQLIVDQLCITCSNGVPMNNTVRYTPHLINFEPQLAYVQPDARPKPQQVSGEAYVRFRWNRADLDRDFVTNRAEIQKIHTSIEQLRDHPATAIQSIVIHGYASPEGAYWRNAQLASQRAATVTAWVKQLATEPDSLFRVESTPEDWAGLKRRVEAAQWPESAEICRMIESSTDPDELDETLRAKYPTLYHEKLLRTIYPLLRKVDYTINYRVDTFDLARALTRLNHAPQTLSLSDFYRLAATYQPGSRDFNHVFAVARNYFPDDPTVNLNAANVALSTGDLTAAQNYLTQSGDSSSADVARGVIAFHQGDYERAEALWSRAAQAGNRAAQNNLKMLRDAM